MKKPHIDLVFNYLKTFVILFLELMNMRMKIMSNWKSIGDVLSKFLSNDNVFLRNYYFLCL